MQQMQAFHSFNSVLKQSFIYFSACTEVCHIATTHEVWQACLQLCWPSHVELTS